MYNKLRKLKYVNKIAGADQIRTGMKKYISRGVCRFFTGGRSSAAKAVHNNLIRRSEISFHSLRRA